MAGLDAWFALTSSVRTITVLGDSVPGFNFDGTTVWTERLRTGLQYKWGYGGHGYIMMDRPEWVATGGSWTRATNANPWGVTAWRSVYTASGSSNIYTMTKPSTATVASFDIYYVDGTSSGNFSYRVDGGAWTNISGTHSAANLLRRVTISTAVTSTIEVRAANAAGTSVTTYLAGVRLKSATPGLVIDNLGVAATNLGQFINTPYTQYFAMDPPDLLILNTSNDATQGAASAQPNWISEQDTLWAATSAARLAVCDGGQLTTTGPRPAVNQAWFRNTTKNRVAAAGGVSLDMYQFWGDYNAGSGLWVTDFGVHPSNTGYADMEERIRYLLVTPRPGIRVRV